MKNKKLIFSVLFTGILFLNTFLFTNINENRLQLNSLFTLATAQTENVEDGENSSSSNCESLATDWCQYYYGGKEYSCDFEYSCSGTSGTCMAGCKLYLASSWHSSKNYEGYYPAASYYADPIQSNVSSTNC